MFKTAFKAFQNRLEILSHITASNFGNAGRDIDFGMKFTKRGSYAYESVTFSGIRYTNGARPSATALNWETDFRALRRIN